MSNASRVLKIVAAALAVSGILFVIRSEPTEAVPLPAAAKYLGNVQTGNPGFQSMGRMSFGPDAVLLISDPQAASIVAIDTGDRGPVVKLKKRIDNVRGLIASGVGAKPSEVEIVDMAVNRKSGTIYLAVHRQADKQFALLTIDGNGKLSNFALESARYVRIGLPGDAKVRNITDVEFAGDRVLAAGQSNEEFASKIYSLPLPLVHGSSAAIFSAETYHVSHKRWETKAPIQSFVPHEENGKSYVVGSFSCTPIAKFPVDELSSGAHVKGESIVELGSGNRPLDMFTYERDGKSWLVTNTYRFHFKRSLFGRSKWWGVRVSMDYLSSDATNENAPTRDVTKKSGPEGIEIVDALFGAIEVDKLNDNEMVVLRDADGELGLEVARLP